MLAMLIWKPVMWVAKATRDGRRASADLPAGARGGAGADEQELREIVGEPAADGVEVQRQAAGLDHFPERVPVGIPPRGGIRRVGDGEAPPRAAPGHPPPPRRGP